MQEEYFGNSALDELPGLLDRFAARRVFIVAGERSFAASGAEARIRPMFENIACFYFESSQNPDIELIRKGIGLFRKVGPDTVIAVGGGSAIDTAKAVNVLACQEEGEPEQYLGGKELENGGKPLIALPTTSGTGSEATHFATIYIDGRKYSLANRKYMLPTVSIVDPLLTESLPAYITAYTGLDAICQGIESFWSINSTEEFRKYAIKAIRTGMDNIERAVKNPDRESRYSMAKAANLSGKAINISKTTACHSVSYPMTSIYGIPHGHAVALTIPSFMEFNSDVSESDCNDRRGVEFVNNTMQELCKAMGHADAPGAKEGFIELMTNIGVETRLGKMKIHENDIEVIVKNGFTADRMKNNPRKVDRKDLERILEDIR